MITIHFYLDTRATAPGEPAPLKLVIGKRSTNAMLKTGITLMPKEWDGKAQQVILSPRRRVLNMELSRLRLQVEDWLRPHIFTGELADMSATDIKRIVDEHLNGARGGITVAEAFARKECGCAHSRAILYAALRHASAYDEGVEGRLLRSINAAWVQGFHAWMSARYAPNSVASTVRSWKTIWHMAEKRGDVSGNPWEAYSSATVATRKRDLTLDQLRTLWNADPLNEGEAAALDMFRLSFLLRAMNPADMYAARMDQIFNGRLYYIRAKTGKQYSVKIEPEALAIIQRRSDGVRMFSTKKTADVWRVGMAARLRTIAARLDLPEVTPYWARHTLASLLFADGVSMDTVSAVLGHSVGAKITATYVDIRETQVDGVMRSVIDKVVK